MFFLSALYRSNNDRIKNKEYRIDNVPTGTYTLRVSKAKHVTREYTVTVGTP